ncbi:alpha/beta fold hydrolase [Paraconexibacter antarcticus]|uniref:Alpha/beta fold hydrolase n=1 Tax=Paraconexibacter antarcticus TaxID=2949664 RepID=A0ABY5DR37_9ACTN|nr:lipase family protein [Paraconexibacter antarcticus]UTI63391.1 alpha/beta fold hydrolase [Paraconexibacter antarcticus]
MHRLRVVRAVAVASLSLAGVAATSATAATTVPKLRTGPSGVSFYTPPAGSLHGSSHGGVIWERRQTGADALKGAGRATLVLYRSIGVTGKAVAVSGSVTVPRGKAPKGGWPVVTWAHGTTGIADACAPTRSPASGKVADYTNYVYPQLKALLARGYAVVRTDYEGLGTPGVHPYLVGRSEGRSVMDMVRAARKVNPAIGRRVIVAGHSQGGHAALWATSIARTWTPELKVAGTVAFAPASHLSEQAALIRALGSPGGGLSALAASILRGIDVAGVGVDVPSLLSPAALALYPQVDTLCQPELGAASSFGGLAPKDILKADVPLDPLVAAIDRTDDPENLKLRTPVLVEQGSADTTVFPSFNAQLVDELRAKGAKVDSRVLPGVTHGKVVKAGLKSALSWMAKRLK